MIDAGDIHLADIKEQRRLVLIVSNKRFNVLSGRAIVAPEYVGPQPELLFRGGSTSAGRLSLSIV